jgi:hypothetical protein
LSEPGDDFGRAVDVRFGGAAGVHLGAHALRDQRSAQLEHQMVRVSPERRSGAQVSYTLMSV